MMTTTTTMVVAEQSIVRFKIIVHGGDTPTHPLIVQLGPTFLKDILHMLIKQLVLPYPTLFFSVWFFENMKSLTAQVHLPNRHGQSSS